MIPEAAIEAAAKVLLGDELGREVEELEGELWAGDIEERKELARKILEAAAPPMLIHVHHHDIEHHARSFNEGYETAMAQELADNPSLAQDWLDEKLAAAWDAGREEGYEAGRDRGAPEQPNPYRSHP